MADIEIRGEKTTGFDEILTDEALAFVADLVRTFRPRVRESLAARQKTQERFDAGERPTFLEETASVREDDWTVAPLPDDLQDRRVEITGPVDRKMVINALNSGARVFMADFEDSNSPTWENIVAGQLNLRDAVNGTIDYFHPVKKVTYTLDDETATLMVRPRGWHLEEKHILIDGEPATAGLVDFGLFLFWNAKTLLDNGSGPYFYLPKLENHREARLWNDVFVKAQDDLGIPQGSIKATVLLETITAAFEMDEILYELRDHSAGLNCGRWDYIFSFIKKFRNDEDAVMPDRGEVGMTQPFMRAYSQLVIRTCHRRGVHAMGGMAAQIPIKGDPEANEAAIEKVRQDKIREARDGHDGTWVAHPGLVRLAEEIFDEYMPEPNQIDKKREDVSVTDAELLEVPEGERTIEGLRHNIRVGVQYIEAWLRGIGCVPLYNLMEDAATAEICRTQNWQWIKHGAVMDDGEKLTVERFREQLADVAAEEGFEGGRFADATKLFDSLCTSESFVEFLTLPAYELLVSYED
jgi:malate synthase